MATVSSHTLNGTDGSHAGDIAVRLVNRNTNEILFETAMDSGGRLSQDIDPASVDTTASYELVFHTGSYWASQPHPGPSVRAIEEVVVRFSMPDPDARYHMPVILSPNSYSVWWSQPE